MDHQEFPSFFLFKAEWYSITYVLFSLSFFCGVDTEIVFTALVIIANKAAMDMAVQIIPPDSDSFPSCISPEAELLDPMEIFSFSRNLSAVSRVTAPAYLPTNSAQKLFLHILITS